MMIDRYSRMPHGMWAGCYRTWSKVDDVQTPQLRPPNQNAYSLVFRLYGAGTWRKRILADGCKYVEGLLLHDPGIDGLI